jgi:hypothetical protein
MVQPGFSMLHYQPFSTTDLLNWRYHTPPYAEKAQAMVDLLESYFRPINPLGMTAKRSF